MNTRRSFTIGVSLGVAFLLGHMSDGTPQALTTRARPASPGDHDLVIRVGDLDRRYTVHVPLGYDGTKSVPIVVMLHGGGGTGKAAATETGWAAKADEVGFLVVFPDATPPDP